MRIALIIGFCFIASIAVSQDHNPPGYFDPARFETDIVAFEEADSAADWAPGSVIFYGSSSIRMWHDSLAADMSPLAVVPRGFGGSTMIDALNYTDRVVIPRKPKAVVLYEGDNDIGQYGVSPERVTDLFRSFVEKVHESLPETKIYFLTIKPSPSRWEHWPEMKRANRMIRDLCDNDLRLHYLDVATPMLDKDDTPDRAIFLDDMLHMNRNGYHIWKKVVREALLN